MTQTSKFILKKHLNSCVFWTPFLFMYFSWDYKWSTNIHLMPGVSSFVLQGAAAVAGAGVIQTICLPLLSVYEGSSNGASQVLKMKFYQSVYRHTFMPCMSYSIGSMAQKHSISMSLSRVSPESPRTLPVGRGCTASACLWWRVCSRLYDTTSSTKPWTLWEYIKNAYYRYRCENCCTSHSPLNLQHSAWLLCLQVKSVTFQGCKEDK